MRLDKGRVRPDLPLISSSVSLRGQSIRLGQIAGRIRLHSPERTGRVKIDRSVIEDDQPKDVRLRQWSAAGQWRCDRNRELALEQANGRGHFSRQTTVPGDDPNARYPVLLPGHNVPDRCAFGRVPRVGVTAQVARTTNGHRVILASLE